MIMISGNHVTIHAGTVTSADGPYYKNAWKVLIQLISGEVSDVKTMGLLQHALRQGSQAIQITKRAKIDNQSSNGHTPLQKPGLKFSFASQQG